MQLCQENTDDGSVIPLGKKDHVFFGTNEDDDNIYINYEEYDKNTGYIRLPTYCSYILYLASWLNIMALIS